MPPAREPETSELLVAWGDGDPAAGEQAMRRLYPELRKLAAARLRRAGGDLTLQPTELANETYLKLVAQRGVTWANRSHFLAISARVIRRILLNHVRDRRRLKRGGGLRRIVIEVDHLADVPKTVDFEQLEDALDLLAEVDSQAATIVELRFLVGLSVLEVAEVLCVSESTVARQWRSARLWLKAKMRRPDDEPSPPD